MKELLKKIEWNKRIGNKDKGTEDYINPIISWCAIGGTLLLAIIIGLIIVL